MVILLSKLFNLFRPLAAIHNIRQAYADKSNINVSIYVSLIRPILFVTWLIQQTKKNNHQVSKKQRMFLQAHYIYTVANLPRATDAQQR